MQASMSEDSCVPGTQAMSLWNDGTSHSPGLLPGPTVMNLGAYICLKDKMRVAENCKEDIV